MGKIATRRAILRAALALFVARGFHDTSTARIAGEAGVATGTLFHHFENKAALIDALHRYIAGARRAALVEGIVPDEAVARQLRTLLVNDLRWTLDHPDQDHFLAQCRQTPGLAPAARPDAAEEAPAVVGLLARGRSAGALRDLPPALLARLFFGMSRGLISHVQAQPELADDPVFLDQAAAVVWDGLRRPAAAAATG